jgi:hypothetical protein
MTAKTFELRDNGTFIPVLAVKLEPGCEADRYLLARAGFGEPQGVYVLMLGLDSGEGKFDCDPYGWGDNRTRFFAHKYIIRRFDEIESGSVVDVQFIIGETLQPKHSESVT